jgi:hypothetical protein
LPLSKKLEISAIVSDGNLHREGLSC